MIWLTAALGMGIGSGNYVLSAAAAGMILVVMWVFPYAEQWIDSLSGTEQYEIVCAHTPGKYEELLTRAQAAQLKVITSKCNKANKNLIISLLLQGSPARHAALSAQLLDDPAILEFRH